jgi:aminopeptidase-like protein
MITGKDLIDLGFKPNKLFKEAIEYVNNNNLTGDDLKTYMDSIQPIYIEPQEELPFDEEYFCRKYNICLNQHFYHKAYKKKYEQHISLHNNNTQF